MEVSILKNEVKLNTKYITINVPKVSVDEFVTKMRLGKSAIITMKYAKLEKGAAKVGTQTISENSTDSLNELIQFYNEKHKGNDKWTLNLYKKEVNNKGLIRKKLAKLFDVHNVKLISTSKYINGLQLEYLGNDPETKYTQVISMLKLANLTAKGQSICETSCRMF